MEDDRVSLLEQQLAQAKLIAEEADKKYEEVGHQRTKSEKNKGSRTLYFSWLGTNYQLLRTFKAMTFLFINAKIFIYWNIFTEEISLENRIKKTEFHSFGTLIILYKSKKDRPGWPVVSPLRLSFR